MECGSIGEIYNLSLTYCSIYDFFRCRTLFSYLISLEMSASGINMHFFTISSFCLSSSKTYKHELSSLRTLYSCKIVILDRSS